VVERRRRKAEEGRGAFEAAAAQQHGREGRRSEGGIPHLNQVSVGRGRCRLAWVTRRESQRKRGKRFTPGGTRTHNRLIRSQTPYPLGHGRFGRNT
jgi:hypothetical protein